MPLSQPLIGLLILIIAIFIGFKLIKSIIKIGVVIALVLVGAYLLFGGIPRGMPFGEMGALQGENETLSLPQDSRVKDIIVAAKDIAWGIEIVATQWDSDGTLLVAVTNTGQFSISGVQVWVNGEEVEVTNSHPGTIEKGDTVILDTNYMAKGSMAVRVKAGQAEDEIAANH